MISNYHARIELVLALPDPLKRENICKIVCSFVSQKIEITSKDSISCRKPIRVEIGRPSRHLKFHTYHVTFPLYFKFGIYHTIFHSNNGKFNYDSQPSGCNDGDYVYIYNDCELKFKVYLNIVKDKNNNVSEISRNLLAWIYEMKAIDCTTMNHDRYIIKQNRKTAIKIYNCTKTVSPDGYRMCFIYKENNILIGLNPIMEYYEQTRIVIEEIQSSLLINEHCVNDITWIHILFEYVSFIDIKSNNFDINTLEKNHAYDCNDDHNYNEHDDNQDYNSNYNSNYNYNYNYNYSNKNATINSVTTTQLEQSTTEDDISININNGNEDTSVITNHNSNSNSNSNPIAITSKSNYHRNTLKSITDGTSVYDTVGYKESRGLRCRVCDGGYFRESWCRGCIIFDDKPNVISSCVMPIKLLNWWRFQKLAAPHCNSFHYDKIGPLQTQQIPFGRSYPHIDSKHKNNFKIWLTNRSIVETVKKEHEIFKNREAYANRVDFDAKYNCVERCTRSRYGEIEIIGSMYDWNTNGHLGKYRFYDFKGDGAKWESMKMKKKYNNKRRKRKRKWTKSGYFDKRNNVKWKNLRKQKYKENFKLELYDCQCNFYV